MPSIKDVARHAGVSISTVSNVIRGGKFVGDELTARVQRAIDELGYVTNPIASGLKSGSTKTIGVVVTNIQRVFFPQVIAGIQDACGETGYNLHVCDSKDDIANERKIIRLLAGAWVDGILLDSVAPESDDAYFASLKSLEHGGKRIPVVSLERRLQGAGIDSVVVDNERGAQLATRHLVDCGCRKIAFISGPMNSCMVIDRHQGYRAALADAGLDVSERLLRHGDFSPQSGYEQTRELLRRGIEFDGLFAANDQMAIGALEAIGQQGLQVPEQVRVVGFDNSFVASIVTPSLTTVDVPKYRMGREAASLLVARIQHPQAPASLVELPVNMIVRQSTDLRGEKAWDLLGW